MAQQKMIVKIMSMNDPKTKQKAMEAVADVNGVESMSADLKEQKLTVIGQMDAVAVAKKLKKIGKLDIISFGPAAKEQETKKDTAKKDDTNKKPAPLPPNGNK